MFLVFASKLFSTFTISTLQSLIVNDSKMYHPNGMKWEKFIKNPPKCLRFYTYHHTAGEGYAAAAVSVGDYIAVADTEEGYSCQPHWV